LLDTSYSQKTHDSLLIEACPGLADTSNPCEGWYVLWTRSNHEKNVAGQLAAKGYEVFLPMISEWSGRRRGHAVCQAPMFRSYLFLRHRVDKKAYLDICNTKGLVSILGERWDKLATIPDHEIQSIKLVMNSHLPTMPYPWLSTGSEVRITRGSLANAQGILVDSEIPNGLFVISVKLLQRSVAVKVDCADVERV
jgi:transcription antitermination factor NusG